MINPIIFLISLEKKVKEVKSDDQATLTEYKRLEKGLAPYKKEAAKIQPSLGQRVKAAANGVANVARNVYDNTVGYGIAKVQNYGTKRHFKKDPASKNKIVYLMHGIYQNEGSQWKLAKQLKKEGYKPLHLKGHHRLSRKEAAEKGFEQIDDFHKYTKLKDAEKRSDHFSGHSSGADVGIYMAGDERIRKYGIKNIQARAPVPYGVKGTTIGQKMILLSPQARMDNLKKIGGKRRAVEMGKVNPKATIDVIAGKYDELVTPPDAVYKKANKYYVIDDPDSGHFGTTGTNPKMDRLFVKHLKDLDKEKYDKAA